VARVIAASPRASYQAFTGPRISQEYHYAGLQASLRNLAAIAERKPNSPRRHLFNFRKRWIDMVPSVTTHTVRHNLRPE
jgi:hypothetical protein